MQRMGVHGMNIVTLGGYGRERRREIEDETVSRRPGLRESPERPRRPRVDAPPRGFSEGGTRQRTARIGGGAAGADLFPPMRGMPMTHASPSNANMRLTIQ